MLDNKTITITVSPEAKIRGAFLNIPKILNGIGYKCLILTNSENTPQRNLPENTRFYKIFFYDALKCSMFRFPRILKDLIKQFLVALTLISVLNTSDLFLFSHTIMPIPLVLLKLLKKKSLVLVGGLSYLSVPENETLMRKLTLISEDFYYKLSDAILVVSKGFIKYYPLSKYKKKIFETPIAIVGDRFLSKQRLAIVNNRRYTIGYIGRLSWEKGIVEFVDSLPSLISKNNNINVLIIGDGSLKDFIVKRVYKYKIEKHVKILPWVENVEKYLRKIKLLVIPSHTEGLPSILIEAMICGTPVLATPVGAIPEIIDDNENGFLLRSNNPKNIADKIIEILGKHELLEKVSKSAYGYVRENFSYEKTLDAWRKITKELEVQ